MVADTSPTFLTWHANFPQHDVSLAVSPTSRLYRYACELADVGLSNSAQLATAP